MTLITSTSNPRVGRVRDLHTPRGRKKQGCFLMEGPRLLEALLDAGISPLEIYFCPSLIQRTPRGRELLQRLLAHSPHNLVEVSERVIEALGETHTSQGLLSVLANEDFSPERTGARRPAALRPALLILDGLSDPGNMGTILRTALAADVEEVVLTPDCVDYFSPKVVRAAAGAHVALPVALDQSWEAIASHIERRESRHIYLAEAGSSLLYYELDLRAPFALIIGSEARGPSQQARDLATESISIPLANHVESLNAAMATGIILYEAMRQLRAAHP